MSAETSAPPSIPLEVPERIWLHRISYEGEIALPLLNHGVLTIGFSEFSNAGFLASLSAPGGWEQLEQAFDHEWGNRPRSRHFLWRFLVEMQPGDWVIVPSWGVFSLYRIVGPARLVGDLAVSDLKNWHGQDVELRDGALRRAPTTEGEPGDGYDLGFYREVAPIRTDIPRGDYADAALTSRMKYRGTNIDCSDLRGSIAAALDGFSKNQPINLRAQILEAGQLEVLRLLQEQLVPDKLEKLVAWYFESLGASRVELPPKKETGKQGDGDIIAIFEPLRTVYYVQAKHHTRESDRWAIDQISAYVDHKSATFTNEGYTHVPWVISTAERFGEEAVRLAAESGVLLINGPELAAMILETGIAGLESAFG